MSMLRRYDPFSTVLPLRDVMNQLFDGSVIAPRGQVFQPVHSVPMDVFETDDAFVVKAYMPGFTADQIQISIEGDAITISGEYNPETPQNVRVLLSEWGQRSFRRAFRLPLPIEADKVEARMDNGVLFLMLPKVEAVKPRKIRVTSA